MVVGIFHASGASGGVGAAVHEVAPRPAVSSNTTSDVRGDVNVIPCEDTDRETRALASGASTHPAPGASSPGSDQGLLPGSFARISSSRFSLALEYLEVLLRLLDSLVSASMT